MPWLSRWEWFPDEQGGVEGDSPSRTALGSRAASPPHSTAFWQRRQKHDFPPEGQGPRTSQSRSDAAISNFTVSETRTRFAKRLKGPRWHTTKKSPFSHHAWAPLSSPKQPLLSDAGTYLCKEKCMHILLDKCSIWHITFCSRLLPLHNISQEWFHINTCKLVSFFLNTIDWFLCWSPFLTAGD